MRNFFFTLCLLLTTSIAFSQTDPFAALDSGVAKGPEYATATFKGTRLINFMTVEVPGKNTLDFRISHRFGDISNGMPTFYGLDGPANIWLGLDYSFNGRLMVSLGRTNIDKTVTTGLKYKWLRQTIHSNAMPVTVTLFAGWNIVTLPAAQASYTDEYKYMTDRYSFLYQVMIARKFNEHLSLQLSPTMIHYNEVVAISDKNDVFAVPVLGRYKFSRSVALTAEYGVRINKYSANFSNYQNVMGGGFDIETGGHVFQIFFTNALDMLETQTIPYTQKPTGKQPFCLGFNISRMFSF